MMNMMNIKTKGVLITTLTAAFFASTSAHAAVLASYEFENTGSSNVLFSANTSVFEADTVASNITVSAFGSSGSSLNALSIASTDFIQASEGQGMDDGTDNDMAGAIAADQYFGFTVTADSGFTFDLDDLTFDIWRNDRGTLDYALRSSVDGFASDIVFQDDFMTTSAQTESILLSDPSFDNLVSVEFRIYFDDRVDNNNSLSATYIDNVILNGAVIAVPEPSAYALFAALIGFACVAVRRFRA